MLEEQSAGLMNCLAEFNIQGELVRVTPGPVITLFEIRPAPGVRVGRFTNLTDDLARSLKAEAIRIQAPVPGCDTVGVLADDGPRQGHRRAPRRPGSRHHAPCARRRYDGLGQKRVPQLRAGELPLQGIAG